MYFFHNEMLQGIFMRSSITHLTWLVKSTAAFLQPYLAAYSELTELFYKSKMFFILPSIILFSSNIGLNLDIEIPEDE